MQACGGCTQISTSLRRPVQHLWIITLAMLRIRVGERCKARSTEHSSVSRQWLKGLHLTGFTALQPCHPLSISRSLWGSKWTGGCAPLRTATKRTAISWFCGRGVFCDEDSVRCFARRSNQPRLCSHPLKTTRDHKRQWLVTRRVYRRLKLVLVWNIHAPQKRSCIHAHASAARLHRPALSVSPTFVSGVASNIFLPGVTLLQALYAIREAHFQACRMCEACVSPCYRSGLPCDHLLDLCIVIPEHYTGLR